MNKKLISIILTLVLILGLIPVSAFAAERTSSTATEEIKPVKVVVSVEGLALDQGFFIEPTIITFQEFIDYWQTKGFNVKPEEITAGGMISRLVYQNGYKINGAEEISVGPDGPGYLSSVTGIADEKQYGPASGWMYTEGHWMSDQSMAAHVFYAKSKKHYTLPDGEKYYVVRLQYTKEGLGADLGFDWNQKPDGTGLYGDQGKLFALYAKLKGQGAFETEPAAQEAALEVMKNLQASQEEVDAAYNALLSVGQAEKPEFTKDLSDDISLYSVGAEANPLAVETTVSEGTVRYQWYQSSDRYSWVKIENENGSSYTPATLEKGTTYYKCIAINEKTALLQNMAESVIATVIVGNRLPQAPYISSDLPQTATYSLYAVAPAPLSVTAWGPWPADGSVLSYQWYQGEVGVQSIDQMIRIDGATNDNYTPDVNKEGARVYACRITNTLDGSSVIADSRLCTVTVSNDVIMIYDEAGLNKIRDDVTCSYKLANDIELTEPWNPIESFSGTLDGDGHAISGFNVDSNSFGYGGGLFAYTMSGATIKNLGLVGKVHQNQGNVNASALIGAIYGDTTISNCYVNVEVTGNGENYTAGGLVGNATSSALIENCYFVGTISGVRENATVGGIIGDASSGVVVKNCYTTTENIIGNYGSTTDADTWNNYCASENDEYASKIPADMEEFLVALNKGGDGFVADKDNINNGYPVLSWQAADPLDEVREAAKAELEAYMQQKLSENEYRIMQRAELERTVASGKISIDDTTTEQEIAAALAAAKAAVDRIKTDAQMTASDKAAVETELEKHLAVLLKNVPNPIVNTLGGEWSVIDLARAGYQVPDDYYENYYNTLVQTLIDKDGILHPVKYTEYARVILALSAIGYDPTDVCGYNMFAKLTNMEDVSRQGTNGPIFTLIAYDSHAYDIPASGDVTREKLVQAILDSQLEDGGWALVGSKSDADLTGMALQALAPYYKKGNVQVVEAVDKALDCLSALQKDNGNFASYGIENLESCVQVIVALTSLGINPTEDERFVTQSGNNPVSALLAFALEDGGFSHTIGDEYDPMSTDQGIYALISYVRFLNGQNSLYDMSDVTPIQNPDYVEPEDKDITLIDINNTGITVTGKDGILNDKMELEVNLLTSGELYDKVKAALKGGKFALYDLCLLENNMEVQPDVTITLSFPVPDGYDGAKCKLYRIGEDGKVTEVAAALKDGKLLIETDEIGAFAIWQPVSVDGNQGGNASGDNDTNKPDDNNENTGNVPQTGDTILPHAAVTVMMLSFAVMVVLSRKKKQSF